jgi:phosphatidylglycerophosphate synthase
MRRRKDCAEGGNFKRMATKARRQRSGLCAGRRRALDEDNVSNDTQLNRRPLQTRSKKWAQALAAGVARTGLSPNAISVLGLVFAGVGAVMMLAHWWWVAAVCVQLRLLCNMLDGLVAVEHGKGDKLGGFFNEVPDRVEDVMLLLAAGHAAGEAARMAGLVGGATLGWAAALLAVGTAYIRQTGVAMGLPQDYSGPMAKPQRMFLLTVSLLAAEVVLLTHDVEAARATLGIGVMLIGGGTAATLARRTVRLAEALKAR